MPDGSTMELPPLKRMISLDVGQRAEGGAMVGEDRRLEVSFSSERPVDRWFGKEILLHGKKNAKLERLNDSAPLLFNHHLPGTPGESAGVIEKAWVGQDKRGYAIIRFARNQTGDDLMALVNDGVARNVSFMYRVIEWEQTSKEAEEREYRVTEWEALEVSIVSVPADPTVGIGRDLQQRDFPVGKIAVKLRPATEPVSTEEHDMPDERKKGQEQRGTEDQSEQQQTETRVEAGRQQIDEDYALKADERRREAIRNLAQANSIGDDIAQQWIRNGTNLETVADQILAIHKKRGEGNQSVAALDLTEADKRQYSLARAILACKDNRMQQDAPFELECHNAIAERSNKMPDTPHVFYVPLDVQRRRMSVGDLERQRIAQQLGLSQRDLTTADASAGGFLVQTSVQGFDELLRNISVVMRMGATRLTGLRDNVTIPRQTGAATADWLTTEADTIAETQQTFTQLPLTPHTVGAYTELSRKLLLQASLDIEGLVNADLAAVVALAADLAALQGSGAAGQPTGLINVTGIGAVADAVIDYADILEFQSDVATSNVMPMRGGYVTTPAVAALLMARSRFANTDTPLWSGNLWNGGVPFPINEGGFPAMSSNQVPAADVIFGDWAKMVIAEWGVLEVDTNPYAGFTAGIIGVRAMYSLDVGVRYPAAFSRMDAAT